MIDGIAEGSFIFQGGDKMLTREEIAPILQESLKAQ